MAKRHEDALNIQQGACNPSGVARALVKAIDECREEGKRARDDSAVMLILHQLCWISGLGDVAIGPWNGWDAATAECESIKAAATAANTAPAVDDASGGPSGPADDPAASTAATAPETGPSGPAGVNA